MPNSVGNAASLLAHLPNYAFTTSAENRLVGFIQNIRFATNNAGERIKAWLQSESMPSVGQITGESRSAASPSLSAELNDIDNRMNRLARPAIYQGGGSPSAEGSEAEHPATAEASSSDTSALRHASDELASRLQRKYALSSDQAQRIAEGIGAEMLNTLTGFLVEHRAAVHAKICSTMDYSVSRSLHNGLVDSRLMQWIDARRGIDRRHAYDHETLPASRPDIIRSLMSRESLEKLVARQCLELAANVDDALPRTCDEEPVRAAGRDWLHSRILLNPQALGPDAKSLAIEKATQRLALELVDQFMSPRAEVVQAHARTVREVTQSYVRRTAQILNEARDPRCGLKVKPRLLQVRKDSWREFDETWGSYAGLDAPQSRMMKHMSLQYSDANYSTARWANTAGSAMVMATLPTQLLAADLTGHLLKAFANLGTGLVVSNSISMASQMLVGDIVTNARALRRYVDAAAAPPRFSAVYKSAAFKENRYIIKTCRRIVRRVREGVSDAAIAEIAQAARAMQERAAARFGSTQDASAFLASNRHFIALLADTCDALEAEHAGAVPARDFVGAVLDKNTFDAMSDTDTFIRLACIEGEFRDAARITDAGHDTLHSLAAELISNIGAPEKRAMLLSRLSNPPPAHSNPSLPEDILVEPRHAAQLAVSLALRELGTIKVSKLRHFLDDTAADASTRAVVRGAIANVAISATGGLIGAVPGMVAGSLLAPGVGTAAAGSTGGLVVRHTVGKLGAAVASEIVTRAEAKAAADGRLSKSVLPGVGVRPVEEIAKEIGQSRQAALQKLHEAQIDAVVVARIDDLCDRAAKHRLRSGRLLIASLFNTQLQGELKLEALRQLVELERDIADIAEAERVIGRSDVIGRRLDEAADNASRLSRVSAALQVDGSGANRDAFATHSIRTSKESKVERFRNRTRQAAETMDRLRDVSAQGTKLLQNITNALVCMKDKEARSGDVPPLLTPEDVWSTLAPLVYPVCVVDDEKLDAFVNELKDAGLIAQQVPVPFVKRLAAHDRDGSYDFDAIVKTTARDRDIIDRCQADIATLARDHFHYTRDEFDSVSDRFKIYHRANISYDTAQRQVRSYAEVSGTGVARVGARLAMALTTSAVSAAAGATSTGISAAARSFLGTDVPRDSLSGFRAGVALAGQTTGLLNIGVAPILAATRGDRLALRPAPKAGDIAGLAPFSFRSLGTAGIEELVDASVHRFLQKLLEGKGTHKTQSFERNGTLQHPLHSILDRKLLGLSTRNAEERSRYDSLADRARSGEGRSAKRRLAAEIAKSAQTSFNSLKFAFKDLQPSDARAIASLNRLHGELVRQSTSLEVRRQVTSIGTAGRHAAGQDLSLEVTRL